MIIVAEGFRLPEESAGIFIILGKEKVLPKKFAEDFAPIARFRNLLVHEYVKIDMRKVYVYLQNEIVNFDKFAKAVIRYVNRT